VPAMWQRRAANVPAVFSKPMTHIGEDVGFEVGPDNKLSYFNMLSYYLAEEAVVCEPVSGAHFPANREKNRDFSPF